MSPAITVTTVSRSTQKPGPEIQPTSKWLYACLSVNCLQDFLVINPTRAGLPFAAFLFLFISSPPVAARVEMKNSNESSRSITITIMLFIYSEILDPIFFYKDGNYFLSTFVSHFTELHSRAERCWVISHFQ